MARLLEVLAKVRRYFSKEEQIPEAFEVDSGLCVCSDPQDTERMSPFERLQHQFSTELYCVFAVVVACCGGRKKKARRSSSSSHCRQLPAAADGCVDATGVERKLAALSDFYERELKTAAQDEGDCERDYTDCGFHLRYVTELYDHYCRRGAERQQGLQVLQLQGRDPSGALARLFSGWVDGCRMPQYRPPSRHRATACTSMLRGSHLGTTSTIACW